MNGAPFTRVGDVDVQQPGPNAAGNFLEIEGHGRIQEVAWSLGLDWEVRSGEADTAVNRAPPGPRVVGAEFELRGIPGHPGSQMGLASSR